MGDNMNAIAIFQAIKSTLETITATNGYSTTLAAVSIGRAALAVGNTATLPVVTLTSVQDDPATSPLDAGMWHQTWTRTIELEALVLGDDAWESALNAVLDDIRRALARHPYPLLLGRVAFQPPVDGGNLAALSLALSYSYTVDYS
jgi:hypothetical protein